MPVEANTTDLVFDGTLLIFKLGYVIFAMAYFIFSLIVIRQVSLMNETVITEGGRLIKALVIVFAGICLGVVILFVGLL